MILNKHDKTWVKQDLAMAKILEDYGFVAVYRLSDQRLLASFDNGPFLYDLPCLCFPGVNVGEIISIDKLISFCKERCK